jgi:broad specificity phosphatase PhoE
VVRREAGYGVSMRSIELLRHTDNDGDKLTAEGIEAAEAIGRQRLSPPYALFGSTGAGRATEMVKILRRAVGQEDVPVTELDGLRSSVEDRWREAAKAAGKGADVEAIRAVDPELVEKESALLGGVLRGVFDSLPDGARALVVGHSPTNEAAVLGIAGVVVGPLGKGEAVVVVEEGGRFLVPDG